MPKTESYHPAQSYPQPDTVSQAKLPLKPIEYTLYDLSPEDMKNLPEPLRFDNEPIPRRKALGLLIGGGIGILGGVSFLGASLIKDISSPQPEEKIIAEKSTDQITVPEPLVHSMIEHNRVYISKDEILAKSTQAPKMTFAYLISGTDAVQMYEQKDKKILSNSGTEAVWKNGLEYVRFTLRPSEHTLHLRSIMKNEQDEIIKDVSEELPQLLQKFSEPGNIALYHENVLTHPENTKRIHTFYNSFDYLFPEHPPFLTIRAPLLSEPTLNLYPDNYEVISPEIPLSENDVMLPQNDLVNFTHIQKLTNLYYTKILTVRSGETYPSTKEYVSLRNLQDAIDNARIPLILGDFTKIKPNNWRDSIPFTIANYIFHPATYTPEIASTFAFSSDRNQDILSFFLFMSLDKDKITELGRRVQSLNQLNNEYSTDSSTYADYVKRIIFNCTQVFTATNEKVLENRLPYLKKLSDELELGTMMQEPPLTFEPTRGMITDVRRK